METKMNNVSRTSNILQYRKGILLIWYEVISNQNICRGKKTNRNKSTEKIYLEDNHITSVIDLFIH